MTGPYDGIIGVEKQQVLQRFLTSIPTRFEPATGDVRFSAVVIECDQQTGRATAIERLVLRQ
jgi:calcineurin-like phosphoesterase